MIACTALSCTQRQGGYCVYQALYGSYGLYCCLLNMFMSEVDHEKYPQVQQKYWLEKKQDS
ncbi:MAG: DUF1653 domain-containing protein [Pseudobutyrivibrio sp.]|nr:DUF1653 domain-containing protein [Pseudobutyrivibrio sp.]